MKRLPLIFLSACAAQTPATSQQAPARNSEAAALAAEAIADADRPVVEVPLTGCSWQVLMQTTVGTQTFALDVDTGSGTTVIPDTGCATCTTDGETNFYTPGATATDLKEQTSGDYDTGEIWWKGEAYSDAVTFGGVSTNVNIAAMQSEADMVGPFTCDTPQGNVTVGVDGIIGFASNPFDDTTAVIDTFLSANNFANAFSMHLCHLGGQMWLGGQDAAQTTSAMQYTPLATTNGYYLVDWAKTTITNQNGDVLGSVDMPQTGDGSASESMVDSGGPPISVDKASFDTLAQFIEKDPAFAKYFPGAWFLEEQDNWQNCETLDDTPDALDAELPTLTVTLGTTNPIDITLTATESYLSYNYLGPPSNQVTYCQILQTWAADDFFDLGQHLMMNGHVAEFDRGNMMFGVAGAATCY